MGLYSAAGTCLSAAAWMTIPRAWPATGVAHVAEEIAHARRVEFLLHFVLLELVARKDDQAPWLVARKYRAQELPAEGAGAARDEDGLVIQHACGLPWPQRTCSPPSALLQLVLERLVLVKLDAQKAHRHSRFLLHAPRGQQVQVCTLVRVVAEVVRLDQPPLDQRLQAIIDASQADAELVGDAPLARLWVGLEHLEDAVASLVVEHDR
jgi:hypothetical protein